MIPNQLRGADMGNEALARRARLILEEKMNGRKQIDVANELGVVSAHLYRLLKQSYLSPTLKQAMVDAGWLIVNKRSPRISIQRDDPEAAAQSIINLMDKETALSLARRIYRHCLPILDNVFVVSGEGCKPVSFTDMVVVSEAEDEDTIWVELEKRDG